MSESKLVRDYKKLIRDMREKMKPINGKCPRCGGLVMSLWTQPGKQQCIVCGAKYDK